MSGSWQPVGRIDLRRLDLAERIEGGAALLLFLSLQLPWYTVAGSSNGSGSASAMVAGGWRWLIWILSLGTAMLVFLRSVTSWREPAWLEFPRGRRQLLLAGAAVLDLILVLVAGFGAKAPPPTIPASSGAAVGSAIGADLAVLLAIGVLAGAAIDLLHVRGLQAREAEEGAGGPAAPGRAGSGAPAAGAGQRPDRSAGPAAAQPRPSFPRQPPAEPGSGPPTGWMPPVPPPPPPL